ncbi:NAD(P)H-binding protein, partial [Streptomyces spiralis]
MLTLVTGTTGQVGRRFVPRLLAQRQPGEQVRVLVRDAARGERFAELGAQVAVGDMRDEETLGKALAGVDAVVNVAASFRGVPDVGEDLLGQRLVRGVPDHAEGREGQALDED